MMIKKFDIFRHTGSRSDHYIYLIIFLVSTMLQISFKLSKLIHLFYPYKNVDEVCYGRFDHILGYGG